MPAFVFFPTKDEEAAEQFVREYVLDAIPRADDTEGCEGLSFTLNDGVNPDGGSARITVYGDPDEFLTDEEPIWEEFKQSGEILDWEIDRRSREEFEAIFGDVGAELTEQLLPLADRMAAVVYEEFETLDDLPAPYNANPGEDGNAGWWIVPHHIAFAPLDYSAAEEIEMHKAGIEEDLKLIAEDSGEDAVDEHLDSLLADLNAMREDVKAGRTRFQN